MGFKKKVISKAFSEAVRNPGNLGRYVKRLVLTAAVLGILFVVVSVLFIGYSVNQVSKMISNPPDIGMTALEDLVSEKALVLTQEQKEKIQPLLSELMQKDQISQEAQLLKNEIFSSLDNKQLELVKLREEKLKKEAENLTQVSRTALDGFINKYIGTPLQEGGTLLKNISAWWQVNSSGNDAPQNLLKQIESSQ